MPNPDEETPVTMKPKRGGRFFSMLCFCLFLPNKKYSAAMVGLLGLTLGTGKGEQSVCKMNILARVLRENLIIFKVCN